MATNLDDIQAKVTSDSDTSGIDDFSSHLSNMADVAGGIIGAGIFEKLADSVMGFVGAGFQAAQQAEIIGNTFNYAFGKNSGSLLENIDNLSAKTVLANEQLDGMAIKLKKLPEGDITGYLKDITNIASGTGLSIQEIGQKAQTMGNQLQIALNYGAVNSRILRPLIQDQTLDVQKLVAIINAEGGAYDESATAQAKDAKTMQAAAEKRAALQQTLANETQHLNILNETHVRFSGGIQNTQKLLDAHNLSVTEAQQKIKALNDELAKSAQAMSPGQKHLITTQDLTNMNKSYTITVEQFLKLIKAEGEGQYTKAAETQAKTLAGTWQNLGKTYIDMAKDILGINAKDVVQGGSFFGVLKEYADTFFKFLQSHKGEIDTWFKNELQVFMSYVIDHKSDIIKFFTDLNKNLADIGKWFTDNKDTITALVNLAGNTAKVAAVGGNAAAGAANWLASKQDFLANVGGAEVGAAGPLARVAGLGYMGSQYNNQRTTNLTMNNNIHNPVNLQTVLAEMQWLIQRG